MLFTFLCCVLFCAGSRGHLPSGPKGCGICHMYAPPRHRRYSLLFIFFSVCICACVYLFILWYILNIKVLILQEKWVQVWEVRTFFWSSQLLWSRPVGAFRPVVRAGFLVGVGPRSRVSWMVWVRGWEIHRGDDPRMCVFVRVRVFVYPPQINRYINVLVPLLAVPMATGTSWLFKASGRCLPHLFLFIRQDTLLRSLAAILISTYTFWTCKNSGVMTVCKHTSSGLLWPTCWLYGPKIQGPDV